MDKNELLGKTLVELRKLASKYKVKGRSRMTKADLIEALTIVAGGRTSSMRGKETKEFSASGSAEKKSAAGASGKRRAGGARRKAVAAAGDLSSAASGKSGKSGKKREDGAPAKKGRRAETGAGRAPSASRSGGKKNAASGGSKGAKNAAGRAAGAKHPKNVQGKGGGKSAVPASDTKNAPADVPKTPAKRMDAPADGKRHAEGSTLEGVPEGRAGGGPIPEGGRRGARVKYSPRPRVKMSPGRAVEPHPVDQQHELPPHYGEDRLVLMVRDPYWLFTYWELSDESLKNARASLAGRVKLILRVHDVTGVEFDGTNSNRTLDIDIPEQNAGNWYINVWGANVSYLVEIGYTNDRGLFVPITRSNTIEVPSDKVSPRTDDSWLEEELAAGASEELVRASLEAGEGASSADVHEMLKRRMQDISSAAPSSFSSLALSSRLSSGMFGRLSSGALSSGAFSSGAVSSWGGSPARGRLPGRGEAAPGAAPGMEALFMPEDRTAEVPSDFWLVVNTELIVYGATEPDAVLTIQGHRVKLRPDGTFSVRFALPDGRQVIRVEAVSSDGGHRRSVTPVVEKKTE